MSKYQIVGNLMHWLNFYLFSLLAYPEPLWEMSGLHPCQRLDFPECHLSVLLYQVFTPPFIAIGLLGNIMSIIVLSRKRMCSSTTSVYLRLLAVMDTFVLIIPVLQRAILYHTFVDIAALTNFSCKIHRWLASSAQGSTCWLLPAIAVDRLISVKYPVWAKSHCTRRMAATIGIVIVVVVVSINSHFILLGRKEVRVFSNRTNSSFLVSVKCDPSTEEYKLFRDKVWSFMLLVLYNILPVLCLVTCSILLYRELSKRSRLKQDRKTNIDARKHEKQEFRSVTKMLISICVFYVIIYTPLITFLIIKPYVFNPRIRHDIAKRLLVSTITQLILYSNNIVNFILYSITGSVFRKELLQILRQMKKYFMRLINRRVHPEDTIINSQHTASHGSQTGTSNQSGNQPGKTPGTSGTVETLVGPGTQ